MLPGQREGRPRGPVPGQRARQGTAHDQVRGRHQDRPGHAGQQLGEHLLSIAALGEQTGTAWQEIVPVSAKSGDQVALLADLLVAQLPEGPPLYPEGELTDAPEEVIVAELIREAALEGVRDELPHSIAVVVEEMGLREGRAGRTAPCSTSTPTCSWSGPRRRAS